MAYLEVTMGGKVSKSCEVEVGVVAEAILKRIETVLQAWTELSPDLCQLLDGWHCDTAWTDWDKSVRERLSKAQQQNDELLMLMGKVNGKSH